MASLGELLARNARRAPDRDGLIFGERRLSYAELDGEVNRTAHALARRGLGKGDRLALMSPNTDAFVIVFYAAMRLGLIAVPVNPRSAAPEVAYLLDDSGTSVFVFDPSLAEVAVAGRDASAGHPAVLAARPTAGYDDLATLAAEEAADDPRAAVDEADDAEILYTSGTTGRPKGVLFDHHRLIWVAFSVDLQMGFREHDRMLHVAPLYHSAELNLFLNGGTLIGATHVVLPAFDPTATLDAMERERISAFFGVPAMYQFLLAQPDLAERDLSTWRIGMYGAAPMPTSVVERLTRELPAVELYNLCGLTEAGPGGVFLGPRDQLRKLGAGGTAVLNTEARVVDEAGRDVAPGETGELILRGEMIMKEYWNNPEATVDAIRDGWLYTGDLGQVDDEGYVTLVDRKKDMIITGGMNVYSIEVENALAAHPDVVDCAVVGAPHPVYGESIMAVVTP
ncbi:MAG: class I adenylate-forming enzyme family protein, partial [Streptosporangiaceae bacterium]